MEIISDNSKYVLVKELGLLINSEVRSEFDNIKIRKINADQIIKALRRDIDDDSILYNLGSVISIALNVTEDCNFRCRYCSFSGIYENERLHSDKTMDYETAVNTIDFFLNLINSKSRYRKRNVFSIGFYGGEPLLEFGLIKKIIGVTEKLVADKEMHGKFKIVFRITTNGALLTGKIVEFLKNKDVLLDISFDGPESEQNRFRLGKNGEKTWGTVMDNIRAIYENYPGFYKTNVSYLTTLHPLHDEERIERFFKRNPNLFDTNKIRFNTVNRDNLKPGVRRKMEKYLANRKQKKEGDFLFKTIVANAIEGKFKYKELVYQTKFTGTCFPGGEKVLIDTGGNFHICEKMLPHFSIGNLNDGFNFDRIRNLQKMYNEEVIRHRCWECDVWFLCDMCFARAGKNKTIEFDCSGKRESYKCMIEKYLNKLEAQSETVDHHFDNAAAYIEQL